MNAQALNPKKGRVTANHNQTMISSLPNAWPNPGQTVRIAG
jgi:hypothetical protein